MGRNRGGQGGGRGRGQGGGNRPGSGPGGVCACPNCDYQEPHQTGVPCYSKTCPKCGVKLIKK
jgi:hypothetical protein